MSDTFATALWAPDALFELLRAGVDGVNVHVRPYTINAAFAVTPRGLGARPLLYGLILFARTLGPGAQLLDARLTANHPEHVKVWAVRDGGAKSWWIRADPSSNQRRSREVQRRRCSLAGLGLIARRRDLESVAGQ